jgi:hypothetical protein
VTNQGVAGCCQQSEHEQSNDRDDRAPNKAFVRRPCDFCFRHAHSEMIGSPGQRLEKRNRVEIPSFK